MNVTLSPVWGAGAQIFDNNGTPLVGGKIYTYAAGTTTPAATYTSNTGTILNTNPIILNSGGRVPNEIWLNDGLPYKLILTDANDVLIATYDNFVGINSTFYIARQEIQTATAGQTVFTLTTMGYVPGTNNLTIFVDGINQYGPGVQYSFRETSPTTVTFNSGLTQGAQVKFVTANAVNPAFISGAASDITYQPPFVGSGVTNVKEILDDALNSGSPHYKQLKVELERLSGSNFPQGLYVDEVENRVYIGHSLGGDALTKYAVYDWTSGALLGWFTAGSASFPEGFAVVHESGSKYLYTRSTSSAIGPVGKYDITSVSLSGGDAPLITSYAVDMHYQMAYDGSNFYIEQAQSVGTFFDRAGIAVYDASFNLIRVFEIPQGYFGSNTFANLPKKQAFAARAGVVALGIGASASNVDPETRLLQGCRVFSFLGDLVTESLHVFNGFVNNLNLMTPNNDATYAENEGIWIDKNSQIYTLFVTDSTIKPLKILREFCFPSTETVDFSDSAQSHPGYIGREIAYPQKNGTGSSGQLRKILTGAAINSVKDVFKEMLELGVRRYEFYTSNYGNIEITTGVNLPAFSRATIYNLNNTTGFLHVENVNGIVRYLLQYDYITDVYSATLVTTTPLTIADANDVSAFANGQYRTTSSTANIPGTFGTLVIERYDPTNIYQQFTPNQNASQTHREFYRKFDSTTNTWTIWYQRWGTNNTTVDVNGFIKEASPIVKLYSDRIETNDQVEEAIFEKIAVGVYEITKTKGLAKRGWFIETPKDINGNAEIFVLYSQDSDNKITIETFEPKYQEGKIVAGDTMDIPDGRWVDLRLNESQAF